MFFFLFLCFFRIVLVRRSVIRRRALLTRGGATLLLLVAGLGISLLLLLLFFLRYLLVFFLSSRFVLFVDVLDGETPVGEKEKEEGDFFSSSLTESCCWSALRFSLLSFWPSLAKSTAGAAGHRSLLPPAAVGLWNSSR
jgi:hypothetical protein